MKYFTRFLVFLFFNFFALSIGVWLMNDGPQANWYIGLNKAPWTPAGWVFGFAWTTIMIFYSFYMAKLSFKYELLNKKLVILYSMQWILNVSWNLAFFNMQNSIFGLVIIFLLWFLIGYFTFKHIKSLRYYTLLIAPYLIWMTIATSLNLYIVLNN